MNLGDEIIAAVLPHPAIQNIRLVGSRADGRATHLSDWDFRVEAKDFAAAAEALPQMLAPLGPLVQQWDRLSPEYCWMLILRGPTKVDLIFPDEPHSNEPPWKPTATNLGAIDEHFWDWMLWLRPKSARGQTDVVAAELQKCFDHLLSPLGVRSTPASISQAIAAYRDARSEAERRFGCTVRRDLESEVAPALASS